MNPIPFEPKQRIELQFDSGHHFVFLPFTEIDQELAEDTATAALLNRLSNFALLNADSWQATSAFPWLLYKLWHHPNPAITEFGLLLCIETSKDLFDNTLHSGGPLEFVTPLQLDDGTEYGSLTLKLRLSVPRQTEPITLYVDFGNTRTMAFLASSQQFRNCVQGDPLPLFPVAFVPRNWTWDLWDQMAAQTRRRRGAPTRDSSDSVENYEVVDSWVMLLEPQFTELRPPVRKGLFVESSPAVIGGGTSLEGARYSFMRASLNPGGDVLFQSAPKRLICDDTHVQWCMLSKDLSSQETKEFDAFVDYRLHNPANPPSGESQKSDAVVLFALGVLEAAARQMHSRWGAAILGRDHKYLDQVVVTHPSCWTASEKRGLEEAWKQACRIYADHRTRPGTPASIEPTVKLQLNEALTAQVPYACAERNSLKLQNWLQLYGRGNDKAIRVLNVDVGGGTTDISIITYSTQDGNRLAAKEEFEHSLYVAGDSLVKQLIQRCLLPKFLNSLASFSNIPDPDLLAKLDHALKNNQALEGLLLKAINNGFVPIVHHWMSQASQPVAPPDSADVAKTSIVFKMDNTQPDYIFLSLQALASEAFKVIGYKQIITRSDFLTFSLTKSELRDAIASAFRELAHLVGSIASQWQCDTVFLSGKVCEIPFVKRFLCSHLSMHDSRIFSSREFHIGKWYPDAFQNRIKDSKSLSAVGLAILDHNLLQLQTGQSSMDEFSWYISPRGNIAHRTKLQFSANNDVSQPVEVEDGSLLWRMRNCLDADLNENLAELVYRVDWRPTNGQTPTPRLRGSQVLRFRRLTNDIDVESPHPASGLVPKLSIRRHLEPVFWKDDTFSLWR